MNKYMMMLLLTAVPGIVVAAASREMERSEYDDVQQIKVNTKIKVGTKTIEKEHIVAPGEHIVYQASGVVIDGVVEGQGKDVKINLHLVHRDTNRVLGDPEATVAWGKAATFTCPGDKSTAELSMVATQIS